MKAAVHYKYGLGEVLSIKELDKPVPKDNEVLIKVYASTVNRSDCHILTGRPFFMRLFTGLSKPRSSITGTDFAGQIEAIGSTVRSFKVGDKVMGFGAMGIRSHAQWVTFPESKGILTMPANLSYEQAVACQEGAFYAVFGINKLKPTAGQNAMVIGATGAIGSSQVQFLKYYGVSVTAVCAGEHRELVQSLGADKIIDYKKEDFMKDDEQYDFIFDTVGTGSFTSCKRLLKKKGIYLPSDRLHHIFLALFTPLFGGKKVMFPMPEKLNENQAFIKMLVEKGSFKPVIDRKYPLDKIADAFTYVAMGQKTGNVIITMHEI